MARKSKLKNWLLKNIFGPDKEDSYGVSVNDASGTSANTDISGLVARVGLRNGDSTSNDFEEAEYDLSVISTAYDTDAYIRQGVDKYVDQIFKEGYGFYGKDEGAVEYIKTRFQYMSETTRVPTEQLLIEIVEDLVKYSNSMVAKVRMKDAAELPPGVTINGINETEPTVGLFPLNPTTLTVKRDKYGTIKQWQQEVDGGDKKIKFKAEDIIHFHYKRERGNAFGTPFLQPVLNDVRALRQAEENALKMLYRNVYPLLHAKIGDDDKTGTTKEINDFTDTANDMDIETGLLVTTNRVDLKPIATNQVVDSSPYLAYLEQRIFSGMGIPAILFGRGEGASRSTGDNMTSEMAGRVRAMQRTIEMFFNQFIVREFLLEGGYDPLMNAEHEVEFRFKENDVDTLMKKDTHAVYLYEHEAIDENELRILLGKDPITDRSLMHQTLITQANMRVEAEINAEFTTSTSSSSNSSSSSKSSTSSTVKKTQTKTNGNKETNNKQQPTNQHGTKTSSKKLTNSISALEGLIRDEFDSVRDEIYSGNVGNAKFKIKNIQNTVLILSKMLQIDNFSEYIDSIGSYLEDNEICLLEDSSELLTNVNLLEGKLITSLRKENGIES